MAEPIKLFLASPSQLFDSESLMHYDQNPEILLERNDKLIKGCKQTIIWQGKYHIAINEFVESKRKFRIANPIKLKNKNLTRQFSFGAWDSETGNIYLFFNAGKEKAKSREDAFTIFNGLCIECEENYPSLLPFAIKL